MPVLLLPFRLATEALLGAAVLALWLRHHLVALERRLLRRGRGLRRRFTATLVRLGFARPPPPRPWYSFRGGHNRTPPDIEETLCRLHVERPDLGLRVLLARVESVAVSPATVRAILIRCRAVVAKLETSRKKARRRRIHVTRRLALWGIDFTLVWILGVVPVWLVGVIDYQGSRLVLLKPVPKTAAGVASELAALFKAYGTPARMLSDNGKEFLAAEVQALLAAHGVVHTRTRPAHPWTNGRIERLFRTMKETKRRFSSVFVTRRHLERFCQDFTRCCDCRPHSSCWGLTPGEVFRGEAARKPVGEVELFDGQLVAHRFGLG